MIEKELKYLCFKKDFNLIKEKLKNNVSNVKKYINYNYYIISNESDLNNLGISLRIRNQDDVYEKTAKLKKYDELGSLSIKDEFTCQIEKDDFEKLIKLKKIDIKNDLFFNDIDCIKNMLLDEKITELFVINTPLKTIREEYFYNNDINICLDENFYFNIIDYEIEVEFNKVDYKYIIDQFENYFYSLGINIRGKNVSKHKRFFDIYFNEH